MAEYNNLANGQHLTWGRGPSLRNLMFAGAAVLILASCGGGGNNTKPTTTTTTPTSTCSSTVSAPIGAQNIVTVAGANVSGVDITVGNPQACPAPNVEVLGVNATTATKLSGNNTGGQIHRGDAKVIVLFGKGLSGSMQVSVSGQPGDFAITNQTGINATDGTPGIQFNIVVSPTAALGARSVILRAANNDITAFTGGLEVIP